MKDFLRKIACVLGIATSLRIYGSEPPKYLVIDVSGGTAATKYPVTMLADVPSGGWTDEYKTTKIVLRRCPKGADPLGRYTLTKDFYAGVFEITQKQWELVMGSNPSDFMNEKNPVDSVGYSMIRGSSFGAGWPENSEVDEDSFIGNLRRKTGMSALDLPTEAQWEYACRAGTETTYYTGNTVADLGRAGIYGRNAYSENPGNVGSLASNDWGLYDMHGNVWEWCLDWQGNELTGVDPVGALSGRMRHRRGGAFYKSSEQCASSYRDTQYGDPETCKGDDCGFRLFAQIKEINIETGEMDEGSESTLSGKFSVSNLQVQQRYPWNGKVDVDFNIVCEDAGQYFRTSVLLYDAAGKTNLVAESFKYNDSGETKKVFLLKSGQHRITWDADIDAPNRKFDSISVTVQAENINAYDAAKYVVIDLSGGADATSYPVSILDDVPNGGWTDEYKKTKLVLRRCAKGADSLGRYTLTQDFYAGVFEVTQKQWELVMGSNPSSFSGDTKPVECVSYNTIRGTGSGAQWPSSSAVDSTSFIGKLRSKTGLTTLDLPTEAQWEYACRAGTTTKYYTGDGMDVANEAGWHNGNSSDGTKAVGQKKANAWGLYDMHGNVWEWCLDWDSGSLSGTDPKGAASGLLRYFRGGCWYLDADFCASSYRFRDFPSIENASLGFRLFRTVP